jgi:hypothetical protein
MGEGNCREDEETVGMAGMVDSGRGRGECIASLVRILGGWSSIRPNHADRAYAVLKRIRQTDERNNVGAQAAIVYAHRCITDKNQFLLQSDLRTQSDGIRTIT